MRVRKSTFITALAFCSIYITADVDSVLAQNRIEGIWISASELDQLPMSGLSWENVLTAASSSTGTPDLSNQDDPVNVRVMAKALVCARRGDYCSDVEGALNSVVNTEYNGRALALGRELIAYVLAADIVDLKTRNPSLDSKFRTKISGLLTTPTSGGPSNLIDCHENRPNNWGTHCGASRIAVYLYLGDTAGLERAAKVFKGWLGDRSSYAGFSYGDLNWQADPNNPVGVNPAGSMKQGHSIDGVLPDDQRRAGGFTWPPPKENYVYEALQGALAQAVMLYRAGYDVWNWSDQALLRAFEWLHEEASFSATGDDTWEPHIINHYYGVSFPAPIPSRPGKNVGWTDWTHGPGSKNVASSPSRPTSFRVVN